jgi:hypothetical protein
MNKEKIAELLRQLHHELGDTEGLDQELADQLRAATQEIESVLKSEKGLALRPSNSKIPIRRSPTPSGGSPMPCPSSGSDAGRCS